MEIVMEKVKALSLFIRGLSVNPPYCNCQRLSFHIAQRFANYPSAVPADYSNDFDYICEKLSLDSEEMETMVTAKIPKVKHPAGEAYASAVEKAILAPKKFRKPFKKKSFFMINIFY